MILAKKEPPPVNRWRWHSAEAVDSELISKGWGTLYRTDIFKQRLAYTLVVIWYDPKLCQILICYEYYSRCDEVFTDRIRWYKSMLNEEFVIIHKLFDRLGQSIYVAESVGFNDIPNKPRSIITRIEDERTFYKNHLGITLI